MAKQEAEEQAAAELEEGAAQADADLPTTGKDFWACLQGCLVRHHKVLVIVVYFMREVLRHAVERRQAPTIFLCLCPSCRFCSDRWL